MKAAPSPMPVLVPTRRSLLPLVAGLLLPLLLLPVHAAQAQALAERCESRSPAVPVTVTSMPVGYTLDTSMPHREIAKLAGPAKTGTYVLGLTKARFNTRITYRATLLHDRVNQQECLLPTLSVTLSYPSMVVYIGREFEDGTCSYRQILMHELRHVQAFQQQMTELETTVRQAMTARFSTPIYAPLGQSLAQLSQEVNTVWKPYILAEQRKVETLQRQVDSPEESRRVVRSCGGELRKTILASRNAPTALPADSKETNDADAP